jgi:hypothetical protein
MEQPAGVVHRLVLVADQLYCAGAAAGLLGQRGRTLGVMAQVLECRPERGQDGN